MKKEAVIKRQPLFNFPEFCKPNSDPVFSATQRLIKTNQNGEANDCQNIR
jgi:hypothetical protein